MPGTKKFGKHGFLDYKMVDSKNVISQVQDLQVLLHDIHAEGMTLSETFQVAAIIEKLPPSWVEFKNYLKHKRKEMSVEDLVVRLRIEEDNKLAQKDTYAPDSAKANMVEHAGSSSRSNSKGKGKDKRKNDKKSKGKSEYLAPKAGIVKQKFQGTCYNCDQPGHRAANCKMPKRVNPRQANMVDENVDMIAMVSDVCAMISEVNLVAIEQVVLYKNEVENQLGKKIKVVRSDRGGEYVSPFAELCAKHGIRHEFIAPYSPHKTYLVKKMKRLLMNYGWEENHHINTYECGLFSPSTAYHFIVHESKNPDIQKNTIMESRNASFFENIFPCLSKETGSSLDDKVVQDKRQRDDNDLQDERPDQTEGKEVEPRRSKGAKKQRIVLEPILFLLW
ncbi:pol polyprotein [Tanacetum coccineum]|uniref:Pol polyprotein n=1 Tax=Tanacetum coccineum TaxID=301880 RepID=A0ABQ5FGA4_9ASTR